MNLFSAFQKVPEIIHLPTILLPKPIKNFYVFCLYILLILLISLLHIDQKLIGSYIFDLKREESLLLCLAS